MIYVASPYSHPSFAMRTKRFYAVRDYTIELICHGHSAFSPIMYCHEFANNRAMPTDAAFWKNFNEGFLIHCSSMHLLKLPEWEKSVGCKMEIEFAAQHQIPVVYVDPIKRFDSYEGN